MYSSLLRQLLQHVVDTAMGTVRPVQPFRSLFWIATATVTIAAATGARNPASQDQLKFYRVGHRGKPHRWHRQQQKRKQPAATSGGRKEHLTKLPNSRATVLEVASAGHVLGRSRSTADHSLAHAYHATGELEVSRIIGARARMKEKQEVLGGDGTPKIANKTKTGSSSAVDMGPAVALISKRENLTADDRVGGGTFATSSDGNQLGAQLCCKCFQAVYENGELWREARNKKSGAVLGYKYGPVLCHAKSDNKACYTKDNLVLTWQLPEGLSGISQCETMSTECATKELTETDGKRLWPSRFQDCLKDAQVDPKTINAYCSEADLQADRSTPIGHVDDDARTCLGVKKKPAAQKKAATKIKNEEAQEQQPKKKPPVNSEEEETNLDQDQPKQKSKEEEEEDPFKAAKKKGKSLAPAATGWRVAWALPVFFAAHATARVAHSGI